MGLKILHSADWHLDSPFAGFSQQQRLRLHEEQMRIPQRITQLAKQERCDLMLLSGDIFDGTPSRKTLETVIRALEESGLPVAIAPGNHDFYTANSPWAWGIWPENVHIFKGGMSSVALRELDCRIYGAAFQSMDCPPLMEGFHIQGDETYHIAVLHADPTRKDSPYNAVTAAQVRASGLHYLALGHVHTAGAFRSGTTYCAWPGCPMGRGWDETGEKGVFIVDVDEQTQIRPVSLEGTRFVQAKVDVGQNPSAALEAALPAVGNSDFYRLELTGSTAVDVSQLRRQFSQFPNLELLDRTEPPVEVWAQEDEDSLTGIYFRMLRKAMTEQPEHAAQIEKAAEISRMLLLGREVKL